MEQRFQAPGICYRLQLKELIISEFVFKSINQPDFLQCQIHFDCLNSTKSVQQTNKFLLDIVHEMQTPKMNSKHPWDQGDSN